METLTKQQAIQLFLEIMADAKISATEKDLIDFNFTDGGQTDKEVREWANDWISEEHSNRHEAKNAWRYEV